MTPVLLDQKGLLKAGSAAILIVAGVFVSGYTIGYRSAASGDGVALNKTVVLALPKPAHADLPEVEPLTPRVQIPGAEIDVDRPDITADAIEPSSAATVRPTEKQIAAVVSEMTNAIEASMTTDTPVVPALSESRQHNNAQRSGAAMDAEVDTVQTGNDAGQAAGQAQDTVPTAPAADGRAARTESVFLDTASAVDAVYTIQVGVFSNANNAIRKKTDLESKKLSAYINEYRNKSDQVRHNVRFGYFKDKSSATAALSRFEQEMSGSGYVTRVRRH